MSATLRRMIRTTKQALVALIRLMPDTPIADLPRALDRLVASLTIHDLSGAPRATDDYDARVLAALRSRSAPTSSSQITAAVGGSAIMVRAAMGRLQHVGLVVCSGRARGTRYAPTE